MNKNRYDWRGNVAVYSERYGWHLKPTEARRQQRREEQQEKRKGRKADGALRAPPACDAVPRWVRLALGGSG